MKNIEKIYKTAVKIGAVNVKLKIVEFTRNSNAVMNIRWHLIWLCQKFATEHTQGGESLCLKGFTEFRASIQTKHVRK